MTTTASRKTLERQIMQTYISALVPTHVNGRRTALLARHGAYDVRLVELPQTSQGDTYPVWIELFDHKSDIAIDSCGGYDFEEIAVAAEQLIAQGERLHRDSMGAPVQQHVAKHRQKMWGEAEDHAIGKTVCP